jgi:hypothetical protein
MTTFFGRAQVLAGEGFGRAQVLAGHRDKVLIPKRNGLVHSLRVVEIQ